MKEDIRPVHPGVHLAEELGALGVSATTLARLLKVPPNRVTEIIKGRRAMTADTAVRLARFFGTGPQFWMNLQSRYDVWMAVKASAKEIMALPTVKGMREDSRR